MNILKFTVIASVCLLGALTAFSKPTMRGVRVVTQPDGTELKICVSGDEKEHFTTTPDGYLLHLDNDGFYRLASVADDGALVSTGQLPTAVGIASKGVRLRDLNLSDLRRRRSEARKTKRHAPQSGLGLFSTGYPHTGSPKGLIIIVEYSDVKFRTPNASQYFHEMINGDNFNLYGGTGSAKQYFTDQSNGKFIPSFDVLGPVTLPHPQAYYGKNDRYGDDENPHLMVTDAIDILNPTVDFSIYDTDKDGVIDNVYIFYAGQGEADYGSENTVWPHSWDVRYAGINKKVNGVTIGPYACSNEWTDQSPEGIGTFVHEFSHVLGLPDLYNTVDGGAVYTPDAYSVMDYGPYNNDGRTPPNYSAYEKNAMEWFEPIMMTKPMSMTLEPIQTGQFGLIPTEKNTEFFLFENRQQTGWDKYIPNHGLLIWHVDYVASKFEDNEVNNTKNHQYVDIVEANNKADYEFADGYTFPGTSGKSSFTSETTPALKSWAGKAIDLPVTNISEAYGLITFDVAGGSSLLEAPVAEVKTWSESERYFTVIWNPVETAVEYFVTVFSGQGSEEGVITTGFDGSSLDQGWTASASDWYATTSNFGESAPSYKFGKNGQSLVSPETDGDITALCFWAKGQSSDGTYLKIEGFVNGQWTLIDNYTPIKNKTEIKEYDANDIPAGARQIRFTMSKATGNVAIDDIVITYGGESAVLPGYDNISTGENTWCLVESLPEDVKDYKVYVTASDGMRKITSPAINFTLKGESLATGLTQIEREDFDPEYYNLQGVKIDNPTKGSIVIKRQGSSSLKILY